MKTRVDKVNFVAEELRAYTYDTIDNKTRKSVEGEELTTLRSEEQGAHELFVSTSEIHRKNEGPPLIEEDVGSAVPGFVPVDQIQGVGRDA